MRKYLTVCCALLLLVAQSGMPVRATGGEEGMAAVLAGAGLDPALRSVVAELFGYVEELEDSFRNQRWQEAATAVDKVDLFYNRLLDLAGSRGVRIDLSSLQAFEFSLAGIDRGIGKKDRALVEKRFLELQPELFDILDRLTATPLRLTACRLYVDLAARGVREKRFDIARDELGEIAEFMEQVQPLLVARGYDMRTFDRLLARAREKVVRHAPDSLAELARLRNLLDHYQQTYASRAENGR